MGHRQKNLFQQNTIEKIVINENAVLESRSEPLAMKATFSEKEFVQKIAYAEGITVAELMRRGLKFYIEWYEHEPKLRKYRDAVISMLKKLP